uniref:Uncharacterized protein n=1 Tax=Setaria italica TaxID=4555 RepID=K3Z130_SETIT
MPAARRKRRHWTMASGQVPAAPSAKADMAGDSVLVRLELDWATRSGTGSSSGSPCGPI